MTIDLAVFAATLGIIATLWRFGTIVATAVSTNERVHDELRYEIKKNTEAHKYELKELMGSHRRLQRRVTAIESIINQHWNFKVRDSDVTQDNFGE